MVVMGCGPAAKLRKAEKLIAKAEAQGAVWHTDSITKLIKVPIPEVFVKEVHHAPLLDTIVMEKERLRIKVVRMPGDSIFIEGKARADTVTRKITTTITKTIKAKGEIKWWWLVIAGLVGMGVTTLLMIRKGQLTPQFLRRFYTWVRLK
jgi:hypothetical protein